MKVRYASTHKMLTLEATPFAQGGEGSLHKVIAPIEHTHLVAKIYHINKRTKQRVHKLRYLIKNPPRFENKAQEQLISWPVGLLEQGPSFVGFLMPKVEGELLEILATAKLPKYLSKKWQRFKLGTDGALELRQKVCFNIAVALYHIHQTGHYVMVDLKPDNILIQPNGLISLVDMDSIEIVEGNQMLFPAAMATPEFAPPEFHSLQRSSDAIPVSWDVFSMAIIFYKILLGIHPFAATTQGKYEHANGLGEKLRHGLYVHNKKQQAYFAKIPSLHQDFYQFPTVIQYLFNLCFVHGIKKPTARPTSEDWCLALGNEQRSEIVIKDQLVEEQLNLYQPALEVDQVYWLSRSFEVLFSQAIREALPDIIIKIRKEKKNDLGSIKKLWGHLKDSLNRPKTISDSVQKLLVGVEVAPKWQPLFLEKAQLLFEAHQAQKETYEAAEVIYQQEIVNVQEDWEACRAAYWDQWHLLTKEHRKKCFEINQRKQEQPLWKAFVGKSAKRKQAFLKQKYLPVQKQELLETYQQKIEAIDTFYQPKWEALEKEHYKVLDQINKIALAQKVLKKQKEESRFVAQRQLIIEAIQTEKETAQMTFDSQEKLLNFSIKNYIEQLEAIEGNAANQLKAIEQSDSLKLMKLSDDLLGKKKELNRTLLDLETSFKKVSNECIDLVKNATKIVGDLSITE